MAMLDSYFDALAGEAVAAAAPFRLGFSGRGHFSAPPGPVVAGQVDMYLMLSAAVAMSDNVSKRQ
jgi:hypothetical protein